MIIHTTAEGISLARKLENEAAAFYTAAAVAFPAPGDKFALFARENQKNISQIERTYYGVITDAIEGCFALDLEADNYLLNAVWQPESSLPSVIDQAVNIETKTIDYYSVAAEQAKALMTDVSRSFTLTAKKHNLRLTQLNELKPA